MSRGLLVCSSFLAWKLLGSVRNHHLLDHNQTTWKTLVRDSAGEVCFLGVEPLSLGVWIAKTRQIAEQEGQSEPPPPKKKSHVALKLCFSLHEISELAPNLAFLQITELFLQYSGSQIQI